MKNWRLHLYILFAAVALRVLYLSSYRGLPFLDEPISDSLVFHQSARTLQWWNEPRGEPFHLSPGYHLWLSAVYHTVRVSPITAVLLQMVMGLGVILLIGRIAEEVFGPREGVIAEIGAALFGPFLFYESKLLAATPSLVAILAALLLLFRGRRRSHPGFCLAGGLVCGIAVLFRPNLLPMIPFAVVWLLFPLRGTGFVRRIGLGVLVALGGFLALLPVTLINYRATGEMILLTDSAGPTFYFGNNPRSHGRHGRPPGFRGAAEFQYADAKRLAEEDLGRSLSPKEISSYWFGKGIDWIRENPGVYLRLELRKFLLLLNNREGEATYNFEFERSLLWPLRIPFLGFGVFLALGAAGVVFFFFFRNSRGSIPPSGPDAVLLLFLAVSSALMCLVFFTRARYRLPMVPVLIMFAAHGVLRLVEIIREKRPLAGNLSLVLRRIWPALLAILILAPIAFAPPGEPAVTATSWNNLGVSYFRRGDLAQAEGCFREALRLDPGFAHAHLSLAVAALARKPPDVERARYHLNEAMRGGLPLDQGLLDYVRRLTNEGSG